MCLNNLTLEVVTVFLPVLIYLMHSLFGLLSRPGGVIIVQHYAGSEKLLHQKACVE